jgi:iron complex outermembrane recepter protein
MRNSGKKPVMKSFWQLILYPIWAIAITLLLTPSLKAEELQTTENKVENKAPQSIPISIPQSSTPITEIPRIGDLEPVHTTSAPLLAQESRKALIQVTGVKINPTANGVEVVLETTTGSIAPPPAKTQGKILYFDIPNAALSLDSQEFRVENPAKGIANIAVTQASPTYVRVQITGAEGVPTAEVATNERGLVITSVPAATPVAEAQGEEDEVEITVTDEQQRGYRVPNASTATKIDAPLRDIPASIQVIPRQVIEDRQVVRLNELADNVSGVQSQSGYGGISSQGYYIRGFGTEFETLRNGFRDFGFLSPRDTANVDRVEFLKGPASVLYGSTIGFGGTVNTITKKPLASPYYNVNMTVGGYSLFRPTFDIGGALTDDKSILYRLNFAKENSDSFRDFNSNRSTFIAPALTWQISPQTKFTIEAEFQRYDYTFDRGLLPFPEFLQVPIGRFIGEPGVNGAGYDSTSITYDFEHKFNDNWRFRQGLNFTAVDGFTKSVIGFELAEDRRTLARNLQTSVEAQRNFTFQNEIYGKFDTGSLRHNFLFGVELARYDFQYDFFDATAQAIDIFNPQYGGSIGNLLPSSAEGYGARNIAVYAQNLIELFPNLKLLLGGRLDFNDSFYRDRLAGSFDFQQSESKFSPRAGIVYQPSDTTAIYASWSNSFNPQIFSRNRTGQPFQPETGQQFELGIKQDFFDKKLSTTLAFYDLTKKNVLTPDPVDPNFSIQTGEQKSRGIELDVAGTILPNWNIIATYAYTDAFVSQDNSIPIGSRLTNIPKNSASLFTTYEIPEGDLKGLGFNLGIVHASEREVGLPNLLTLPAYTRVDAGVSYKRDNYKIALNFKNLFNTVYYSTNGFFLVPQAPFTMLATFSMNF